MTRLAKLKLLNSGFPPPPAAPQPLTAMQLAHGDYTKVQRAFLGADLFTGRRVLVEPTVASAARQVKVSPTLVNWALKRMAQRDAILAGLLPLIPLQSPSDRAKRQIARLVAKHGHRRVAEMLAAAAIGEPVNDNPAPHKSDAALPDAAA
jgi:hypothetical protein